MSWRDRLLVVITAIAAASCATAPKPTAESRKIRSNSPALVEGRVRDEAGQPVGGIAVRGIPWSKDVPWFPPAVSACDGSFRLFLAAPGSYGFLLLWQGTSVITSSSEDPSRLAISVEPGEERDGVELVFLAPAWRQAVPTAHARAPTCR